MNVESNEIVKAHNLSVFLALQLFLVYDVRWGFFVGKGCPVGNVSLPAPVGLDGESYDAFATVVRVVQGQLDARDSLAVRS